MFKRLVLSIAASLALSGCVLMSAPAPLFTLADQPAPPPLAAGTWAFLDKDCKPDRASGKFACDRVVLSRDDSGAWSFRDPSGKDPDPFAVTFAVLAGSDTAPSLLLAEIGRVEESVRNYAVVVPRGADAPARRAWIVLVDCAVADGPGGPLPGLSIERGSDGAVRGCVAENKETAREAARRAALDALRDIGENEAVWVGR